MMKGYRAWIDGVLFPVVTPAKSPDQVRGGVQGNQRALATLDPAFAGMTEIRVRRSH